MYALNNVVMPCTFISELADSYIDMITVGDLTIDMIAVGDLTR